MGMLRARKDKRRKADRSTAVEWVKRHNRNTRICHWINAVAIGFLAVSGVHIFLDFPELYWGNVGFRGHEAVFRLADWGLSWDEAGELGDRRWGRNYHFLFAWIFVINGAVYVLWNVGRRAYWKKMLPRRSELGWEHLSAEIRDHLRFRVRADRQARSYNTFQKLSYLIVLYILFPFMLLSGLAQMPAFNAIAPGFIDLFGGRQTARTLHVIGMLLILGFVVVHVVQVFVAGAVNEIRSMITGRYALPKKEIRRSRRLHRSPPLSSRQMTRQVDGCHAMTIRKPYLIFLGEARDTTVAKTGFGVRDWVPEDCVAQLRLSGCSVDLGLPEMDAAQAAAAGARSLLIGIAPVGGQIHSSWVPVLNSAIENGLDIVSGLHARLKDVPGLAEAAERKGVALVDIRTSPENLQVGSGAKRRGKRLLTVGTDCALGKKYTALALTVAIARRGVAVDFRATGQTGILIAGGGIPIDSVVADFVAGAAERLSPDADIDHWDVIEGQGSLIHPGYAGVTLGLVHGSQPDAIVLCHDPTRTHIADAPHIAIPPLSDVADVYLRAARLTNPGVRLVGVSLNTSSLSDGERARMLALTAAETGVPVFDPMRSPPTEVVNRLLGVRQGVADPQTSGSRTGGVQATTSARDVS